MTRRNTEYLSSVQIRRGSYAQPVFGETLSLRNVANYKTRCFCETICTRRLHAKRSDSRRLQAILFSIVHLLVVSAHLPPSKETPTSIANAVPHNRSEHQKARKANGPKNKNRPTSKTRDLQISGGNVDVGLWVTMKMLP